MAKITGKTFDHKEALKAYGARWNSIDKAWTIDDAAADKIVAMKLPGVIVTMSSDLPKSEPVKVSSIDLSEFSKNTTEVSQKGDVVVGDQQLVGKFNMNPKIFIGFASLGEFVDYVAKCGNRGSDDMVKWAGATYAGSIDLARNGWSDGVDLAFEAAELIKSDHVTDRVTRYSVAGGSVNVGRMLSGNPLHMRLRTRQPSTKVVTMFVDNFASNFVEPEAMIIRAAAIAAMSDILEHNGYSAEIVSVTPGDSVNQNGRGFLVVNKIKTAGEPLNLADVVYALGHPSYFRQMIFSAVRAQPNCSKSMYNSMGFPREGMLTAQPGEFYIPRFNANVRGGDFKAKVRAIFKHIIPADFPVELTE